MQFDQRITDSGFLSCSRLYLEFMSHHHHHFIDETFFSVLSKLSSLYFIKFGEQKNFSFIFFYFSNTHTKTKNNKTKQKTLYLKPGKKLLKHTNKNLAIYKIE